MAKTIALNLTIGGVKQNITNIKQLEEAIKGAEEQLKGLEIGSEQFKKLASEIKQAKSVAEDFQESIKGQDLEKRVGAFAKVGEAITASFAGAQAALSLFGAESEDVAKAAAKAQAILTIALTARSVAEGVVQLKTVAATIATVAQTAATNAATVATRTFYTVLAANPIGAIIAVIGLLVTALVALTSKTEEQVDAQKELAKVTSEEGNKLKEQLRILTEANDKRALQKRTIEDLKKAYPGFNAFLDKENKLNADGIKFLTLKIKQYQIEANVKTLLGKISEQNVKILEIENQSLLDQVGFWESVWNSIKAGGNVSQFVLNQYKTGIENQRKAVEDVRNQTKIYTTELDKQYTALNENYTELDILERKLREQVKTEEKATETAKKNTQSLQEQKNAYEKGRTSIVNFSNAISELSKNSQEYEAVVKKLGEGKLDAKILQDLTKILEVRKQLISEIKNLNKEIETTFNIINKPLPQDVFFSSFQNFRSKLEVEFNSGVGNFQKILDEFLKSSKDISVEQKNILESVTKGYSSLFEVINQTPGFEQFIKSIEKQSSVVLTELINIKELKDGYAGLQQAFADIAAAYNGYKLEVKDGVVAPLNISFAKVKKNADDFIKALKDSLVIPVTKNLLDLEKKALQTKLLDPNKILSATDIKELNGRIDTIGELQKKLSRGLKLSETEIDYKRINDEIDKTVELFNKIAFATIDAEQGILNVAKQVQELQAEIKKTDIEALTGGLILYIDEIAKRLTGYRTKQEKEDEKLVKKLSKDQEGLLKFIDDLRKQGLISNEITNEEILAQQDVFLQAYIAYKKAERDINKQVEEDKRKEQEKTYQNIQKGIEIFSTTLNQVAALSRERTEADLALLEAGYNKRKEIVEKSVGDEALKNKKLLEIQTEYERKKKELEKKGRLDSLRFSLAQTVANGAQAIVRALAELGPVLGPILAAVNAALTLAQVVIIQDQIAAVQAYRRGGKIKKAQGGMLTGPSHENGGIMLGAMGVVAEGNESIINRQSTLQYQDLLSNVNMAGGGRPLVVNNFDDSRIVEALAKQNKQPIRAYVLGSEITQEQAISKRLDDLSKF